MRAATGQPRATGSTPNGASRRAPGKRKPAAGKATKAKTAKRAPAKPKAPKAPSLHARGARVVGVTGPFGSRALVEMPTKVAEELFPDGLGDAGALEVVEAAVRDIAAIRKRDQALGDSALAAAVVALAREICNPYNSATSKSMCARELREHVDRLHELLPPDEETDAVDDLATARRRRQEAAAGATA